MIYHTLYAPASGVFLNQLVCVFEGDFDSRLLVRAWETVAALHPVLRTSFIWEGLEEPLQLSFERVAVPYEEHDRRGLKASEQEALTETYLAAARQSGFNISAAPLMRLAFMRLTDESYQCVWNFHQLLLDGWSVSMLLEEVLAVYDSLKQGRSISLPERAPYAGYLAWLERQDKEGARVFWQSYLAGITSPTPLVKDRTVAGPEMFSGTWGRRSCRLTFEETDALTSFAAEHQLTLNTLVQGAWALLLSRYGGEKTVVFGQVVSGRPAELPGSDSMLGLFINTLPVRIEVPPNTSPAAWLKGLQRDNVELRKYEYSSLMSIQQWSHVPRGVPLFESILVFENYPVGEALKQYDGDFGIRAVRSLEQTNYPLTLVVVPGAELSLEIIYSEAMFDAQTIERMLLHVRTLLGGLADNSSSDLKELTPLTDAERHQLLFKWNHTIAGPSKGRCICELFEDQAASTPDATALRHGERVVTFAELNRQANQLANYLRGRGVGLEDVVGVLVERSFEAVVAIMGVLKAGGAYLPLDARAPAQRLKAILDEARANVVITHHPLKGALPEKEGLIVITLDNARPEIALEEANNPETGAVSANTACVIYTSGSTGTPKGVAQTHSGLLNRFEWMWETYPFRPYEVCCQKTSLSFVDSVWEIFGPLLRGLPLVIIPDEVVRNPVELINTLVAERITRIVLVPSLLRVLVESCADEFARLSALNLWVVSGEPMPSDLLARFRALAPESTLLNLYGSSEVAADVTCYAVGGGAMSTPTVPIGLPIANTTVHLLDEEMRMVPVGVVGEIYVGGLNLARGYLNRAGLTAERFVPDPSGQACGARLYRTGDLARRLPDGNIECLGRADRQVKLRGFRIEPAEVEAALAAHSGVRECVVLLRRTAPDDERLEAYFVAAREPAPGPGELRDFLSKRLPDYMIPTGFAVVGEMPRLSSGKVDRAALLRVGGTAHAASGRQSAPPRTQLEREVAEVWRQVLKVDDIGVDDNFFDVGGNSLLLIKVNERLRGTLKRDLPLVEMLFYPTIGSLARHLGGAVNESHAHAGEVKRGRERKLMKSRQRLRRTE
jgi:amino acid adenylation domain-containing protein